MRRALDKPLLSAKDNWIDERLSDMKQDMATVKIDVAVIRSNYVAKEDLAGIKAGLAKLEASMIKWFIGTWIAADGLSSSIGFALAKLVH